MDFDIDDGWFRDPDDPDPSLARYWENERWTEFVCRTGRGGIGNIHRREVEPWRK
ncbi:MAG TPA: hypothetical protein VJS45_11310 [Acidimicrobiia bacterium]|nr:hypothetical protein [Acidimicrobiia bacterium]